MTDKIIERRDHIMGLYGLDMAEAVLNNRRNVSRVIDVHGKKSILKVDKIDTHQVALLQTGQEMKEQLMFGVPDIIAQGKDYLILENIEGPHLNKFYDDGPDYYGQGSEWCIEMAKKISDDYQLLLQSFTGKQPVQDKLALGKSWFTSRIHAWASHIISAKLITSEEVSALTKTINDHIERKGADSFGWAHGNIHGEHVILTNKKKPYFKPYLLDLTIESRPGNGYYDFLRFLDHLFLMSHQNPEKLFTIINEAMTKYLGHFDQEEVRLVFAFRCIGVLGQDILNNPTHSSDPNMEAKFPYLLKWIRREY